MIISKRVGFDLIYKFDSKTYPTADVIDVYLYGRHEGRQQAAMAGLKPM